MASVLILDYPFPSYGIRMFVTNFFPKCVILHAHSLEQAKMHISKTDLCVVIMDIHAPGGLDMEIIKIMRDINKDLRILMFTDLANQRYAHLYLNAGVTAFLYKSCGQDEYLPVIQKILEGNRCHEAD